MSMPPSALYAPIDLKGVAILITGATAGIGRATAWRYAELGAHLALCGRRTQRLEELKQELTKRFAGLPPPITVYLDVADVSQITALPQKLAAAGMPQVEILINNAGLALGVDPPDQINLDDVQTMLSTNVMGVMALVRVFSPGMVAMGRGHIVNISSVAAHECYVGGSAYCATKHAVNAFTIASRHDLAGTPVRVTAISPGMVRTEFSMVRFKGDAAKEDKLYEGIVPMVAEDVADQIVYATTRPRHVQVADIISYATNQGHAKYVIERKGTGMGAPEGSALDAA